MNTTYKINRTYESLSSWKFFAGKSVIFIGLLVCSFAVFLLGPDYYPLFPTNGNLIYSASLSGLLLLAAIFFKRNARLNRYWGIAFALFIASSVNLVSVLFGSYYTMFVQLFGAPDPNKTLALGKVYDTFLHVVPILVLTVASGANLGSIYLKLGNLSYKWGFGVGGLVLVNYFTSVLIFFGNGYELPRLGSAVIWGVVFSFSNSLLEELWVRGLFLRKLVPLIGATGAILLTSITFAAMHFLGVAYFPASVVWIFVINTFTMGIACGVLTLKTDSIWGAYLIHAAADLFLFIATLAIH